MKFPGGVAFSAFVLLAVAAGSWSLSAAQRNGSQKDVERGKYLATETKSGAILCRFVGERCVATKVNGKYWMYFNVPTSSSPRRMT